MTTPTTVSKIGKAPAANKANKAPAASNASKTPVANKASKAPAASNASKAPVTKQNGSALPWIAITIGFLVIIGLLVALVISNSRNTPQISQPGNQPVAPLTTPVPQTKPTWVESWTVSPVSTDNFVVEYGDWNVTTNDLYTFGDRTVDVTIVVKNTSNKIVVINYAGMNWDRGIQVKPGERTTFTGKAGDFRVTLLDYKNQ